MFCEVRVTKPAQAPKKQKNQTTRCTKPAQAPKKTKKQKFPGTMGPLLSSCWSLCRFGASSGLFFLFFVPVNVLWSQSHQTCTGTKKTKKKQTTRCTKPAQAPKKTKKLKFPGTMGPLLSSCWMPVQVWCIWFFFGFFGACQCFVKSESPNLHRHQKKQKKTNH